jgi:hypothetical protein
MALAGGRPSMVYLNAGAVAVVVAPLALDKGVSAVRQYQQQHHIHDIYCYCLECGFVP